MRTLLLSCLILLQANYLQAMDDARLRVRAIDGNDIAIAKVRLAIHLWTGKWEPTELVATTDAQGEAELKGVKSGQYLALAVEADGYASTALDMELTAGERREITVRLRRPVNSTVRIQDANGKPIRGAELALLHFSAGDGGALYHRFAINDPIPFAVAASDAEGVIRLPHLPVGAKVELSVFHPDYLPKRVDNLRAFDGELTTVQLDTGVELRFKFTLEDGLAEMPKNLQVTTSIDAFNKDSDRVPGLYLPMKLSTTDWHCHVVPASYERMFVRSESDRFTITPMIFAHDTPYREQLNITDSQAHEVAYLVRENIQVRGKLSGHLPAIGEQTYAVGSTENLHPTIRLSDGKTHWLPVNYPTVHNDGSFELSLPAGKAKLSFGGLRSAVVEPNEYEFVIERGKEIVLPDFKIRPLNNVTGRLVDEKQQPLPGAYVRLLAGLWGSHYIACDENGQFSIPPDRIIDASRFDSSDVEVSLLAIDPTSGKTAMQSITKTWRTAQDLVLQCESRPSGWLLGTIEEQMSKSSSQNRDYWLKHTQDNLARFPLGAIGQLPPDLSKGTWLNSKATSLNDLRGKYVLLDFWFIGCGPCEEEIPDVNLLQKMFGGDRFTVVSVHVTDQTVENVRQFAAQKGMNYPIVVDNEDGEINQAISKMGIEGFPTYLLLGPDGRILHNDRQSLGPGLRTFKVEKILSVLR